MILRLADIKARLKFYLPFREISYYGSRLLFLPQRTPRNAEENWER